MRVTSYSVELKDKINVLVKEKAVNYDVNFKLNRSDRIVEMMNAIYRLNSKAEEHIYMLAMDAKLGLVGVFLISKGTVDRSLMGVREIFVRVYLCGACKFVLIHNHPSGDTEPSTDDVKSTIRLLKCSKLMGIDFLDHLIIGGDGYYSFAEHDRMVLE